MCVCVCTRVRVCVCVCVGACACIVKLFSSVVFESAGDAYATLLVERAWVQDFDGVRTQEGATGDGVEVEMILFCR